MNKIREESKKIHNEERFYIIGRFKLLSTEEEFNSYVIKFASEKRLKYVDVPKLYSSFSSYIFSMYRARNENKSKRYLVSVCLICACYICHPVDEIEDYRKEHIADRHTIMHSSYFKYYEGGLYGHGVRIAGQYKNSIKTPEFDEMGGDVPDYIQHLTFQRGNIFHCSFCEKCYGVIPTEIIAIYHLSSCEYIKRQKKKLGHWGPIEKLNNLFFLVFIQCKTYYYISIKNNDCE